MASVPTICNMALAHIGAGVTISSITPPDGTLEAEYCATFYSPARSEMLELGQFSFSLKRVALAEITNESVNWSYAYQKPSDCVKALRVLTVGAGITVFTQDEVTVVGTDRNGADFDVEGDTIFTDEEDAVLLYVYDVTDSTKFSPAFNTALSYLLASYLAGPIVKGDQGMKLSTAMRQQALLMAGMAATSDANASSAKVSDFEPSSIAARR